MLLFFSFLERAWLVGSGGPAGGTIVHRGGAGAVVGVRDVSFSITKGGRRGDKTFQKMLDSIAICVWIGKSWAEQFLLQQWGNHSPLIPPSRCTDFFPPSVYQRANWLRGSWLKSSINQRLLKSNIIYVFKHLQLIIVSFFLQEVHELLGSYDLKYCFVDKYKGTGRSNCSAMLDWTRQFGKFGICKLEEVGIRMQLLYYPPFKI